MTIDINIKLHLLEYSFLKINTFGLIAAISVIVFMSMLLLEKKRPKNLDNELLFQLIVESIVVSLFGARSLFALENWKIFLWKEFFDISNGGISLLGTVILLPIYSLIRFKYLNISFWEYSDFFVQKVPILQAISRIGCLFAGCCVGVPCLETCLLSIRYLNHEAWAPYGITLIPTQLFMSLSSLGIFVVLKTFNKKSLQAGSLLGIYFICEGSARFLIDFWRLDHEPIYLYQTVSIHQIIAFITVIIGLIIIFYREKFYKTFLWNTKSSSIKILKKSKTLLNKNKER